MSNTPLQNDLLLKALRGEHVSRPPVWLMRQAGRYLPEYQKLRAKYSFFERCETPELVAEITTQPIYALNVDAAILFSDILVVPKAMGMDVQLVEKKGPYLPEPIKNAADIEKLLIPVTEDQLGYVLAGIRATKQALAQRVPLIGFAGAPFTLLCYMVEGEGSKTFDKAKAFCLSQPTLAARLLDKITTTTINYLNAQISAGVDAIQIFDSWAGLLSPDDFKRFALPYLARIIDAIPTATPTILFAKGAWYALADMSQTGARALGIDWCVTPQFARKMAGDTITLQGNFDPSALMTSEQEIAKRVHKMIDAFGVQRYIVNLGHGITPQVPVSHARAFVQAVHDYVPA